MPRALEIGGGGFLESSGQLATSHGLQTTAREHSGLNTLFFSVMVETLVSPISTSTPVHYRGLSARMQSMPRTVAGARKDAATCSLVSLSQSVFPHLSGSVLPCLGQVRARVLMIQWMKPSWHAGAGTVRWS